MTDETTRSGEVADGGRSAAVEPPFDVVLVANRGEIARRILRTLRTMGIRSVAVYSDADAQAPHVREADVAVRLGPADAASSYLSIRAVIDAARRTGAKAIHPGYGFLSENAEFARACADADIVFIGPSPEAIDAMGDKITAKRRVVEHGIPVTPGIAEAGLDDDALIAAAAEVGYPLLVKPSAGGGGMGMVEVFEASELPAALHTARRVARAAFGDDTLFLERLVARPRHLEVQVLADAAGHVIHLGERECSLQRRHQKVIEECPSPIVDEALRARLGEAACAVARSVGYTGAGTVEFLVSADDPGTFFFMEMNTRLQVEHPVTELVTGIDLVRQQVLIAAGRPLEWEQRDVRFSGHAVEARVYAEDASRGFVPATGSVLGLREAGGAGIRVDSALAPGLSVSDDYDPMLAKVIAWGDDRHASFERLSTALRDTTVLGVATNTAFLVELVDDTEVRRGRLDTGLIERVVSARRQPSPDDGVAIAAALVLRDDEWRAGTDAPWSRPTGWRLGAPEPERLLLRVADETFDVGMLGEPQHARARVAGSEPVDTAVLTREPAEGGGERMLVRIAAETRTFAIACDGDLLWIRETTQGSSVETWRVHVLPATRSAAARGVEGGVQASVTAGTSRLTSPMPGTVVAVERADGAAVEAGEVVLIIEAMKMEHRVLAPHAGIVRVSARPGDRVAADDVVASVEPPAEAPVTSPVEPAHPVESTRPDTGHDPVAPTLEGQR